MRFRFCGELDCPDWVLAEISNLSKLTSIKLRILCQQVVSQLLNNEWQLEKMRKLAHDSGLDSTGMKGALSALEFIFLCAAKNLCDSHNLGSELEQLGLPSVPSAEITGHILCAVDSGDEKNFPIIDVSVQDKDTTSVHSLAVHPDKLHVLVKELDDALGLLQRFKSERQ